LRPDKTRLIRGTWEKRRKKEAIDVGSHHALGSVEDGPYHPRTRILQSEIFGKEPRHIDCLTMASSC
jgi:hypothetical protein